MRLVLPFLLQADEYVVYSAHQQRMRYLVEFSLPDEDGITSEEVGETGEAGGAEGETREEEEPEAASEGEMRYCIHCTYSCLMCSRVPISVVKTIFTS